jgi:hypothetical protein
MTGLLLPIALNRRRMHHQDHIQPLYDWPPSDYLPGGAQWQTSTGNRVRCDILLGRPLLRVL